MQGYYTEESTIAYCEGKRIVDCQRDCDGQNVRFEHENRPSPGRRHAGLEGAACPGATRLRTLIRL